MSPWQRFNHLWFLSKLRCPNCGVKLGNFLYAEYCPRCYKQLPHNSQPLVFTPPVPSALSKTWLARWFFRFMRWVES